jgi:hypothetical protein
MSMQEIIIIVAYLGLIASIVILGIVYMEK